MQTISFKSERQGALVNYLPKKKKQTRRRGFFSLWSVCYRQKISILVKSLFFLLWLFGGIQLQCFFSQTQWHWFYFLRRSGLKNLISVTDFPYSKSASLPGYGHNGIYKVKYASQTLLLLCEMWDVRLHVQLLHLSLHMCVLCVEQLWSRTLRVRDDDSCLVNRTYGSR